MFGAAAAAGRMLGLDVERMVWVFGNAATQSCGLIENLGSMAKSVSVGNAARNGLVAALLAEQGFTGPARPLEGPYGFVRVTSETPDLAAITSGLGDSWEIRRTAYKPYPCGVVLFPVLDACLDLHANHALNHEQIIRMRVRGNPLLRLRADRPDVATAREAKVGVQHSVAAAFLYGAAGPAQYGDACVADPAILVLRRKVAVEEDAAVPVEAAFVSVETKDGRTLTSHVDKARGTPERPMSDAGLEAKVRALAGEVPGLDADRLIAALWRLDEETDAARILALTVPATVPA